MRRFETPMSIQGTPEQRTEQLYRYLYRLSEQLNMMTTATGEGEDSEAMTALRAQLSNTARDLSDAVSTLRKTVTAAIRGLDTRLGTAAAEIDNAQSDITALSDEMDAVGGTLTALGTRLDSAEGELDTLQDSLAAMTTGITTESIMLGETQLTETQLTALLELINNGGE